MKTTTVITKTKNKIRENKTNIRKLAIEYSETPTTNKKKEKSIISKLNAEKKEKIQLEGLLKKLDNRKKKMPVMVWKNKNTLTENILANLK